MSSHLHHRRLRAPRLDGHALLEPPQAEWEDVLEFNRHWQRQLEQASAEWLGPLRTAARREIRQLAGSPQHAGPILLGGHQPALYHPGVWFKNFVLSQWARATDALAINVQIDSDLCSSTSIQVPHRTQRQRTEGRSLESEARLVSLAVDRPSLPVPYEERSIEDPELFASFANRAAELLGSLVEQPLVQPLWKAALSHPEGATGNLGERLAYGRHQLEQQFGLSTVELPWSRICDGNSFQTFTLRLLADLPRFVEIHNRALLEYRRRHRIRSRAHPVPQLEQQDGWLEAPYWIWSATDPQRRRLFVRREGGSLQLSDRNQNTFRVERGSTPEHEREQFGEWRRRGLKIRSRALVTTMFLRLCVGDSFIHGIGGAKYDQLTDALIEFFFAEPAPRYLVATATMQLPLGQESLATRDELRTQQRRLRELRYHPELFLTPPVDAESQRLLKEKRRWLQSNDNHSRRTRHEILENINLALQSRLENERRDCRQALRQAEVEVRLSELLGSREFSFCLFPEQTLPKQLLELSAPEA